MEGIVVAKVLTGVFLSIFIGIPIYLYVTRPRKRRRRMPRHAQWRWTAGIYVLFFLIFAFLAIGVMTL